MKKFVTHFEVLLQKEKNAIQAANKICDVYEPNSVLERVAKSWVKHFQNGNFYVKNAARSASLAAIFRK